MLVQGLKFRVISGCYLIADPFSNCCNGSMSNFNNFQDPAQGPRPEQDPMVNGVQSGSQSNNDGNNKGQFNDSYQQMPAGGYPPVGSQTAHRFFNWVRNAYLRRRSDDRWIGGVCGGIAERLGWSTGLVRTIMLVFVLFFGAGAAFYGLAWFILPDRHNVIIAEDLFAGKWHNSLVGIIICLIASAGSSWFVSPVVAAILIYVLLAWSGNQARQYGWVYAPADEEDQNRPFVPSPANNFGRVSHVDSARDGQQFYNTHHRNEAGSWHEERWTGGSGFSQAQSTYDYVPVNSANISSHIRRQSAGPLVVTAVIGVMLVALMLLSLTVFQPSMLIMSSIQISLISVGVMCLLLGLLIVCLGISGRRAGGLIPVSIIAVLVVLSLLGVLGGYAYGKNGTFGSTQNYHSYRLSPRQSKTFASSASEMEDYRKGMLFEGQASSLAEVAVDLSNYEATHGTHQVKMVDGTHSRSGCPTGVVNLATKNTNLTLKVPEGCSYTVASFSSIWFADKNYPKTVGDLYRLLGSLGGEKYVTDFDECDDQVCELVEPELKIHLVSDYFSNFQIIKSGKTTLPSMDTQSKVDNYDGHESVPSTKKDDENAI